MQGKLAKEWCIRGRGTLEVGQVNTTAGKRLFSHWGWAGFSRRWRCAVQAADLVVFDIDEVEVTPLEFLEDMPARGSRYVRGAKGFEAVFVNGVMVVERNEYTDAGPCGQVV